MRLALSSISRSSKALWRVSTQAGQMNEPFAPATSVPTSRAERPQKLQVWESFAILNVTLALYDLVNYSVFEGLFGGHVEVAVGILFNLGDRLAGGL